LADNINGFDKVGSKEPLIGCFAQSVFAFIPGLLKYYSEKYHYNHVVINTFLAWHGNRYQQYRQKMCFTNNEVSV